MFDYSLGEVLKLTVKTLGYTKIISGIVALIIFSTSVACHNSKKQNSNPVTMQGSDSTTIKESPSAKSETKTGIQNKMTPKILTNIEEARAEIKQSNIAHGLQLNIADELWDDNPGVPITGMNMAIIVDAVLDRGLFPDGFEQKDGYRIYRYKKADEN